MKPQVKYGLLVGGAVFIIFMVNSLAQLDNTVRSSVLNLCRIMVITFGIYFAMKDKRDETGSITYERALGIGTLTVLIAAAFNNIGKYIYHKFYFKSLFVMMRNAAIERIENDKNYEQYHDQMPLLKKMVFTLISPGSFAIGSIILTVFVGFIISLLVAAILNKGNTAQQPMQEF